MAELTNHYAFYGVSNDEFNHGNNSDNKKDQNMPPQYMPCWHIISSWSHLRNSRGKKCSLPSPSADALYKFSLEKGAPRPSSIACVRMRRALVASEIGS